MQGRSKRECIDEYGVDRVRCWRNSFDVPPPHVSEHAPAYPGNDPRYAGVPRPLLPRGECLRDTLERVLPFWSEHVVPELSAGRSCLVAAHGHSIRALVKHLDGISDADIAALSIPNGIPLVYDLDESLRPLRESTFLGDQEKVANADWMDKIDHHAEKKA